MAAESEDVRRKETNMMIERNGSVSEMNGQGVFAWADITSSPACSSVAKGLTEKEGSEEMGKRKERLEN